MPLRMIESMSTIVRVFSTSTRSSNSYKQWPYEKFRRIGRGPPTSMGQPGKRSRLPYDKRFPLSGKDTNDTVEGLRRGGNSVMWKMIGEERAKSNSAVLKYYDYARDREVTEVVPEMIPEFVVPDLDGFKLKPYVSYRVGDDIQTQPKHTAAELFREIYQPDIESNKKKRT